MITEKKITVEDRTPGRYDDEGGAVVWFAGVVRADPDAAGTRRVARIHYDCYRDMARREMETIRRDIETREDVRSVEILHRVGDVPAGEISLLVVVVSGHRRAAFEACSRAVDAVKERVPIWKKEIYDDETSRWL